MAWHERKYADTALRVMGLVLLALAVKIGCHIFAGADPGARFRALPYLLASIWMVSLCAGAVLAALGPHLFDQVELPARWRIHAVRRGDSEDPGP